MLRAALLVVAIMPANASADSATPLRTLFSFNDPESSRRWLAVNDTVMGGRSDGRFRINRYKNLEFFGNLSLANNGGFASVRTRPSSLHLKTGDSIVLKVRGDGREYSLNLYTPTRRMAFSFRTRFETKTDEWTTVTLPLSSFVATSFGRVVPNTPLEPERVSRIGIMLGDKKAGPFRLEIDSILVQSSGNTLLSTRQN